VQAAAASKGVPFLDLMESTPRVSPGTSGTLASSVTAGGFTCSTDQWYRAGALLRIGSSGKYEYHSVVDATGSGPYTVTINGTEGPFLLNHSAGEPVVQTGPGWVTGYGRKGATNGTGTADRYRGTDTAHPTYDGHLALARAVFERLQRLARV
jgi:hypothetical protein